MDSILLDIKEKIGPSADYEAFDTDIVDAINTAFGVLTQLGVGPEDGFFISDDSATWTDFSSDTVVIGLVKTYIYNKVRLIFDPPINSFVLSAMEKQNEELEWRLNVQVDPGKEA